MSKKYLYIGGGILILALVAAAIYFLRPGPGVAPVTGGGTFGGGDTRTGGTPAGGTATDNNNVPIVADNGSASKTAKIFKLLDGPVAGAILMDVGRPTTTIARFVLADSGRVFDLPLDVPGAVPRAVSNTTIPGIGTVVWTAGPTAKSIDGDGALLQYQDSGTTKTVHLAFPAATTTLTTPGAVQIKFLPDGISSVAASPDGQSVAYLLKAAVGTVGYRAAADGTQSKQLFSLPLTQLILSWPSAQTLLAQSPAAAGVPGVVFSISAQSGTSEPILYADGVTASADSTFSHVIYQTTEAGSRSSYSHVVKTGATQPLSFDPFPERCIWQGSTVVMVCAAPLTYVAPNYLDLWHAGVATANDSIFAFNTSTGQTRVVASPGSSDGGEPADIAALSLSPDLRYMLYIRKGDRSLWAVRLSQ